MPSRESWPLRKVVRELGAVYGALVPPRLSPFELILLENASYLVSDARREEVFEALRDAIGLMPEAILAASPDFLAGVIANGGMSPTMRAEKVRECARIASEIGMQELNASVGEGDPRAKRLLQRFPGIGEPAADRILLLCGAVPTLAPDSNALRVLTRLGLATEQSSYVRTYRTAIEATRTEVTDVAEATAAHLLLRRHGQETCKRSAPRCEFCPLRTTCHWHAAR